MCEDAYGYDKCLVYWGSLNLWRDGEMSET